MFWKLFEVYYGCQKRLIDIVFQNKQICSYFRQWVDLRSLRVLIYSSKDWQVIKIRKVHKFPIQVDPFKFLLLACLYCCSTGIGNISQVSRRSFLLLEEKLVKGAMFDSTLAAFQENIYLHFSSEKVLLQFIGSYACIMYSTCILKSE